MENEFQDETKEKVKEIYKKIAVGSVVLFFAISILKLLCKLVFDINIESTFLLILQIAFPIFGLCFGWLIALIYIEITNKNNQ